MALEEREGFPTRKGSAGRSCQGWGGNFVVCLSFLWDKHLAGDFCGSCVK